PTFGFRVPFGFRPSDFGFSSFVIRYSPPSLFALKPAHAQTRDQTSGKRKEHRRLLGGRRDRRLGLRQRPGPPGPEDRPAGSRDDRGGNSPDPQSHQENPRSRRLQLERRRENDRAPGGYRGFRPLQRRVQRVL